MKSKEARKYIFNSLDDIVHVSVLPLQKECVGVSGDFEKILLVLRQTTVRILFIVCSVISLVSACALRRTWSYVSPLGFFVKIFICHCLWCLSC